MSSLFLLPVSLLAYSTLALAQSSTPASFPAAASTTITTKLNSTTELWPVATIFLPIDVPSNLAASIITAVSSPPSVPQKDCSGWLTLA